MTGRASTTRRSLLRLRAALLALTGVVLATSAWSFAGTHAVLETVRDRTVPAMLDVASARTALMDADAAAVASFRGGGARLIGPGEQYETGLAVANQDLARAAEHNAAGADGSRELQLIAGLLTAYGGWISQADAQFRAQREDMLSAVDLWYAARLLHGDDQIVPHLDALAADQRAELDAQLSTGWLDPVTMLVWTVPALALLALLGYTQVFLRRRFRRRCNESVIVASLVVLVLVAATAAGLVLRDRAQHAAADLREFVTSSELQSTAVATAGQHELVQMVRAQCGGGPDGCGETLPPPGPAAAAGEGAHPPAASATDATVAFASATDFGWLLGVIPALAVAIAGLVLLGLQPRIDEYRYRP
jgi:hypothetical protein